MGRKRNPYLPLYTRDIMSSPRCRALSTTAAGVYLFLLCRLNEPPTPGAFRLSDWEQHPTWRRSLTQQCLANADKYSRLQYFARYLSKNDLPWDRKEVLAGLQELYNLGIIVVEGDMLVQPRMFKDNGFELPDLDNDGDPEGTILDDPVSGSMASKGDEELSENNGAKKRTEKGTQKGTEKGTEKVRVSHASACSTEIEIKNNNIKDSKGKNSSRSIKEKGVGKTKDTGAVKTVATTRFVPPTLDEVTAYCKEKGYTFSPEAFHAYYEANGWVQGKGKPIKKWQACCVTWQQREQSGGRYQSAPPKPQGMKQGVQVTEVKPGQYDDEW